MSRHSVRPDTRPMHYCSTTWPHENDPHEKLDSLSPYALPPLAEPGATVSESRVEETEREHCEKPSGGGGEIDAGGWAKSVARSRDPGDNTLVAKP